VEMAGAVDVTTEGRSVGTRLRPRTLIISDDVSFATLAERLVPTAMRVEYADQVFQGEYDLLITDEDVLRYRTSGAGEQPVYPDDHLFVICIGENDLGQVAFDKYSGYLSFSGTSKATELVLPSQIPQPFLQLVDTEHRSVASCSCPRG